MRRSIGKQRPTTQPTPASESWDDFHRRFHSSRFANDATNNPSVLRRVGQVPNTFAIKESSKSLVDSFLMNREDSMSSLGGSSNSGSERGYRIRRNQGNIKIGQTPKKNWRLPFFSRK